MPLCYRETHQVYGSFRFLKSSWSEKFIIFLWKSGTGVWSWIQLKQLLISRSRCFLSSPFSPFLLSAVEPSRSPRAAVEWFIPLPLKYDGASPSLSLWLSVSYLLTLLLPHSPYLLTKQFASWLLLCRSGSEREREHMQITVHFMILKSTRIDWVLTTIKVTVSLLD